MEFKIPLFKLNFDEEEINSVIETIRSKWISTGPKCSEIEDMFVQMLNVKYALSVSNCTNALHLACIICDIHEGDEVICPSLTFAASVNCIRYVRATPVFCDIKSIEHININTEEVERLITPKTKAILVVHMAGFPAEMSSIMAIAKKNNLKVIEDACHGPLSEYKGEKLGTIGDVGCFSFFSNKNISTGEGGMLVTNNEEYFNRARLLRSHGMTTMSYERAKGHATAYDIVELGYNYRMDDIRASIAVAQMKKLKTDLNKRIHVRQSYLDRLLKAKCIVVPFRNNNEFVSNYIMPVVLLDSTVEKRDFVRNAMHEAGIQTSIHYPAMHRFSIYRHSDAMLPVTEYVSDNEVTLPMYATLSDTEVDYIVSTLEKAVNE